MLPASNDGPKSTPASAPTPTNWKGVRHGLRHAEQCLQAQQLQQADTLIREVLEFAPSEARAWEMLAKLRELQGDADDAARCRAKVEQLRRQAVDPGQPPASVQLAKLLWQQGDRDLARAMLALLLMRRPDDERLKALRSVWVDEG